MTTEHHRAGAHRAGSEHGFAEVEALRDRVAELERAFERRSAKVAELEHRQRLLVTAIEAVPLGVALTDAGFEPPGPKLLFVNDCFCEMTGYTPEELKGLPLRSLFEPEENRAALAQMEADLRAGRCYRGEMSARRKDGTVYVVADETTPVLSAAGVLTHLVSVQRDITERRRSEEALQASQERYRLLIERMNEGFLATDRDNRIDLANAKMVEMLGYTREELNGRYLGNFCDAENRGRLEAQEARRRAGLAEPYELTWTARDGRQVHTIISPTSLCDAENRFIGSFAVITDITERKRNEAERLKLEAQFRQAQKMESLGRLAGGIAHDFNNLLVGMLGNAGLALMELPAEASARQLVRQIETAALRASELTKEMLAYSGKGKFLVEAIDLSALVEEMTQLLQVSINKKALLRLSYADSLAAIEGDPTQLRQIVMNLITNASEAIGDRSGEITITTGQTYVDRAYLASTYMDDDLAAGEYVFLEVTDTGEGMEEERRSKIFDPFFTTKFTGRGLGLAAVLGIVRSHHGAIKVTSEVGRGTTFRVLFPASDSPPEPVPVLPGIEEFSFRGSGCVLVVDDEEMVRNVARMSLETVGYTVLTAVDGVEALEVYQREGERIDAVLLDMTMPRMGGEETYREIRRLCPDAKIVLASGFSEQEAIHRFAGKNLDGFLQKPFQPQDLIRQIRELLEQ